jgi:hypothetical protein
MFFIVLQTVEEVMMDYFTYIRADRAVRGFNGVDVM